MQKRPLLGTVEKDASKNTDFELTLFFPIPVGIPGLLCGSRWASGACWKSALNGTLLGHHFCRGNWSCRTSVKQSMWLGAGGVRPSWEPVVPLGARRGCLTTKISYHAVLGNFTYHVECLFQYLACAYFQQNIWRTKRKQLDYCVDKIFSR